MKNSSFLERFLRFACARPAWFFLIFSMVLVLDYIVLGGSAIVNVHDMLNITVPFLKSFFELVKDHGIVGWFSSWGGGMPVLNYPFIWWKPESLLYLVLSPFWVYVMQYIIVTFIAGYGAYKYFNQIERFSPEIGVIAGVIFTTVPTHYLPEATSLAAIPFFLYCFDKWVLDGRSGRSWLYILGCVLYMLSCNLIFTQPYVFILHVGLWVRFWLQKRYPARSFLKVVCVWFVYLVIQLPLIMNLLVLEYRDAARTSVRFPSTIGLDSFGPLVEHNVFLMSVVLIGLYFSFKYERARFYSVWFLSSFAVRYLWGVLAGTIPFFGSFQCRVFEFNPFIVTAIAACGLEFISRKSADRDNKGIAVWVSIASLSVVLAILYDVTPLNTFMAVLSFALVMVFYHAYRTHKNLAQSLAMILIGVCIIRGAYKPVQTIQAGPNTFKFYYDLDAIDKIKQLESGRGELFRVVSYGITPAVASYHGLQTADMNSNFYSDAYRRYWIQVLSVGEDTNREYLDGTLLGQGVQHVGIEPNIEHEGNVDSVTFNPRLLALINVKYVLSRVIIDRPERYGLKPIVLGSMPTCHKITGELEGLRCRINKYLSGCSASLYKMESYAPRFFLVHDVKNFRDGAGLEEALRNDTLAELSHNLYITDENSQLLEQDDLQEIGYQNPANAEGIDKISYTPDNIGINVELSRQGYLIMTESYSDRWHCFDNGKEVPVLPAYGAFRAIHLDKGEHEVQCRFSGVTESMISKIF